MDPDLELTGGLPWLIWGSRFEDGVPDRREGGYLAGAGPQVPVAVAVFQRDVTRRLLATGGDGEECPAFSFVFAYINVQPRAEGALADHAGSHRHDRRGYEHRSSSQPRLLPDHQAVHQKVAKEQQVKASEQYWMAQQAVDQLVRSIHSVAAKQANTGAAPITKRPRRPSSAARTPCP